MFLYIVGFYGGKKHYVSELKDAGIFLFPVINILDIVYFVNLYVVKM